MNKAVGHKLKKIRTNRNMSQEEVADHLNISQSAYARMERGESHSWAGHLSKICKIFEITPEELFTNTIKTKPSENIENPENDSAVLSDKLIEQYEGRIRDLKKVIKELRQNKRN
ncbi:helix-turn-helix transcriptional regulator [Flavobacterium sp.]|uniref:helix-turn-helix domain-containing protein n=1 Tax=Flavobacterium sp. TaxID=239 RepID=UPI002DB31F23|nr:helix-turn-helix transcriptional regulator [Flavobacterium sp.]